VQPWSHAADADRVAVTGCRCGGFEVTASLWHFTIPALTFLERQRLASRIQESRLNGDRVRLASGDGGAVVIETRVRKPDSVRGPGSSPPEGGVPPSGGAV
jgi:hypothetical protein